MRAFIVAASLFAAVLGSPVLADTAPTSLTLADPAKAPRSAVIVDGATWRCEGATCVASGGAEQPVVRACRRVVARVGAVTAFSYKGVALSAEQLAVCNG